MNDRSEDILADMRRERAEWEARTLARHHAQDQREDMIVFGFIGAALALAIIGFVLAVIWP
ncbi:hypothetical protein HOU00_gp247 [Caulobacter phage CcrPW]|uniref:Uncharacterized protein n=1 Tax=Caulobacter phage CcrPW TaxID=2283271 RepID=A0A385EDR1_9CAUD|nr:hypothetical protein HOU00_gp247 [Caulobacter phage CcrPW]AXQ68878.1 hypothetical protein CcrPW_gp339 [Caulobacter phage CcrPW]